MTNKQFYNLLYVDLVEYTKEELKPIVYDVKLTNLDQVLGVFRALLIKNEQLEADLVDLKRDLENIAEALGL